MTVEVRHSDNVNPSIILANVAQTTGLVEMSQGWGRRLGNVFRGQADFVFEHPGSGFLGRRTRDDCITELLFISRSIGNLTEEGVYPSITHDLNQELEYTVGDENTWVSFRYEP